jgi:hypothetical protein
MASRMDKYQEKVERSAKNEDLYRSIQDASNYSNIEGVVTIDKTNEIDITRVKAMLQNRENYQKRKQYEDLVEDDIETIDNVVDEENYDKNYDIMDVLDKAKEDRPESSENRTLKHTQYNILKRLNLQATPEEETALKELIDTIALRNKEEKENPATEDGGLLDDLKSNTMVGDPTSIKKIITEAKESEEKVEEYKEQGLDLGEIDKSFYTSSLGFTDDDFEDLKNLDKSIKTHNSLLKILIILIVGIILVIFIYFLLKIII